MCATENLSETTRLLLQWREGDDDAVHELLPRVYDELKRIAAGYLRHEKKDHTLQTSGLIHEAYFRLIDQQQVDWQNRAHFLGIAARMMRRVLVDHARRRDFAKRGGGAVHLALDDVTPAQQGKSPDLVALDHALDDLERLDPVQAQVVEMRYFGGLTIDEIAVALDVSVSTVTRKWRLAKAWLYDALKEGAGGPPAPGPEASEETRP